MKKIIVNLGGVLHRKEASVRFTGLSPETSGRRSEA